MSKYIEFKLVEKKPKTNVYVILNKKSKAPLGIIKWFGAWRQYCFFPFENTIFHKGCLSDVIKFIDNLMKERKNKNNKTKN